MAIRAKTSAKSVLAFFNHLRPTYSATLQVDSAGKCLIKADNKHQGYKAKIALRTQNLGKSLQDLTEHKHERWTQICLRTTTKNLQREGMVGIAKLEMLKIDLTVSNRASK